MKRGREMEIGSELRCAIEELGVLVKLQPKDTDYDDHAVVAIIPTKPFLSLCNSLLQVLDNIGPTMAVMRQDIHQNIRRLERMQESCPSMISNLVEILKKEANEGCARKANSCSKAFVWLTRSLDFTLALLEKITEGGGMMSMEEAVQAAYSVTLMPWHGWISSAAFRIAVRLVPDNKTFIDLLKAKDQNYDALLEEMRTFISLLLPFLDHIHSIRRLYHLDKIKAT